MDQENKYYTHSGTIGVLGPIYMLILGLIGAILLGVIYGYAIFYIPLVYLNFFITLGFGTVVGYLVGLGGKYGKVRNSMVLLLFGLLFGLLAEYIGWVSWIFAFSKQEALVFMPSGIMNVIQLISAKGAWSIFGGTPTGLSLYFFWGIEALMIVGMSTVTAWGVLSSTPFCETCNKWVEEENLIFPLEAIENPEDLKKQLEQGDFTRLRSLKKVEGEAKVFTQLKLLHCPQCLEQYFLSIKTIEISLDSDNKEKRDEDELLENLIISPEYFKIFQEQW